MDATESRATVGSIIAVAVVTTIALATWSDPLAAQITGTTVLPYRLYVDAHTQLVAPIRELDRLLTQLDNEASLGEIAAELGPSAADFIGLAQNLIKTPPWGRDRLKVGNSLVTATIASVPPSHRAHLTRLMLIIGLIELLAEQPDQFKTKADVGWAVRWRTVVLPGNFFSLLQAFRKSFVARASGFSDHYVVRNEWVKYERGEFAHIENVLIGERKTRKHIRLTETEEITTTERERTQVNEQDTQTTDRFDLHEESSHKRT